MYDNRDLRLKIAEMVHRAGEGHIPSSFSIVDVIHALYNRVLKIDPTDPEFEDRDFFILSKGHGAAALFVVLQSLGFFGAEELERYGSSAGLLGGHPDATKVPGAEFSTGSLGHGLPMAAGVALGLKIKNRNNKVFVLVGDGECHEGTTWEAAHVATNQKLDNLTVIVDWNQSGAQLMPIDDLPSKWSSFGWETSVIDGHNLDEIELASLAPRERGVPRAIVARTIKGFGVDFLSGHGSWHHKIPSQDEMVLIRNLLGAGGEAD